MRLLCGTVDAEYGKLMDVVGNEVTPWLAYLRDNDSFIEEWNNNYVSFDKAIFEEQRENARSISGHVAATGKIVIITDVSYSPFNNF